MRKSMRKHEIWLIVLTAGVYDTLWNYVQSTEVTSIISAAPYFPLWKGCGGMGGGDVTKPLFTSQKKKNSGVFSLKFQTFNSQMLTFASSGQQAFSPTRGRHSVSLEKPGNSALLIADMARNLFCFISIKGSSWLWFCFLSLTISVCWPMSCSRVGVFHILCNSHIITIMIQLHLNMSSIITMLSGWSCDALEENHWQITMTKWKNPPKPPMYSPCFGVSVCVCACVCPSEWSY